MTDPWSLLLPMRSTRKWIVLVVTGIFIISDNGGEAMVHIQTDDIGHPDSGLTWQNTLPPLRSFSYCVRLYSYRSRFSDYFFSYATEDEDNELAFHIKYGQQELRLACCGARVFTIVNVEVALLKWFSFCVAANLTTAKATFVHTYGIDEKELDDTQKEGYEPLVIRGGGIVIIGQDQDEPGGGTDKGQSFNGLMSDLYLTNEILTKQDMQRYVQCDNGPVSRYSHLIDFNNIVLDFKLGISTEEVNRTDACASSKVYAIFTEARSFRESTQFCSILNGRMALPLDEMDNKALYHMGSESSGKCSSFEKTNGMWIGVKWDPDLKIWTNIFSKEEVSFKNFEIEISPAKKDVCVFAQTTDEIPGITDEDNWEIENCKRAICTACEFETPIPLKIRGLCGESIFDKDYYVYGKINHRPVFNGKSWTKIAWNNSQSAYDFTWVMYQIAEPSVQAKMIIKSELDYPIGVHDFEVVGDKCPGRTIRLKLTSCPNGMYTCNDGSCIEIDKRCNLELNCDDNSDELNCGTLVLPPGYEKRLPPPKKDAVTPAEIAFDFSIRLIRKFSLLDSQLVIDFLITRSWYDSRVQYKNLHSTSNLNLIDNIVDMIWFPDVTLLGADNSIAGSNILSTSGWGERLTEPLPDDDKLLDEDVFYEGSGNPLMLQREISVNLMCTFDLTLYPFDSQQCPLIFYVGEYTQYYVSTLLRKVEFSGTRRLLEYQVTSVDHEPLIYQNKSGQQIQIVLNNLYGYYISSAYVPTLLLVIISYSTFFFSLEDFTNRVMVSLTSLLVLASLFSQIASGLPKTAYMKLIDLWFIFCILSDFVIVMLLVIINTVIDNQAAVSKIQVFSPSETKVKIPGKFSCYQLDPKQCNLWAQVILPVLIGLFLTVYFGTVAYYMSQVKHSF